MDNHPRYRSLFWPILLVGVGLVWLLSNLGYIQAVSFGTILKFWPLLLIILGFDILFSRRYPWVGAVVGLLAVAGVVAFLLTGPKLGYTAGPVTKTEEFSTPLAGVDSVEYDFDTASAPVYISVLKNDSADLLQAEITHSGTMRFDVSGTTRKNVVLDENTDSSNWFNWDFSFDQYKWNIALAPDVPTDMILNGGSGSLSLDLTGVELNSLQTDFGSGSSDIILPQTSKSYTAEIQSGSGSVNINIPKDTSMTLTLDAGSGSNSVNVPAGTSFRIEVMDDGSGSLSLPSGLKKSSDSNDFSVGAWESTNYETAATKVLIQILGQGSGSISIH
jgi:hypothetical protein